MIRKIYILSYLIAASAISHAQISGPDTITAGAAVTLNSTDTGVSYTWTLGNRDITPTAPPSSTSLINGGALDVPSFSATTNDNGIWYTFVTNYYSGDVIRLNHGTSPTNVPTSVNLGNFGMYSGVSGGIDILKDPNTGNWFGFVVNGTELLRLDFGTTLSNTPTSNVMNFTTTLAWPHEFKVKQFGQKWIGFAANRSLGIAKFDFGTSLTNTPTSIELPLSNLQSPVSFSLTNQAGQWYMFVANLVPGSITRLDFGGDINNNTPNAVPLGNFNNLNLTRKIIIVKDCNHLFGYASDEYSQLYKLDFNNNATNISPSFSVLAPINYNSLELFSYKNELRAMAMNSNGSELMTTAFKTFDINKTITNYYTQSQSYTFDTPGVYDIALAVDQGKFLDEKTYCKQIVVTEKRASAVQAPPSAITANSGRLLRAYPNPVKNNLNILIPASGKSDIVISNSLGRIIGRVTTPIVEKDQVFSIDLRHYNLTEGFFYIELTDESGSSYFAKFSKAGN